MLRIKFISWARRFSEASKVWKVQVRLPWILYPPGRTPAEWSAAVLVILFIFTISNLNNNLLWSDLFPSSSAWNNWFFYSRYEIFLMNSILLFAYSIYLVSKYCSTAAAASREGSSFFLHVYHTYAVRHTTFSILWCHFECDYRHVEWGGLVKVLIRCHYKYWDIFQLTLVYFLLEICH